MMNRATIRAIPAIEVEVEVEIVIKRGATQAENRALNVNGG